MSGLILDGRHRFIATLLADKVPEFQDWNGEGNVVDHVISLNMNRRDLSTAQRACLAVNHLPRYEEKTRIRQHAGLKQNRSGKNTGSGAAEQGEAVELAAKAFDVSATNVKKARKIKDQHLKTFERLLAGDWTTTAYPAGLRGRMES